ncbi:hypothetical protein B5S32_g2250 [[Candida] boidinii]|nr:hypothetical protein B5S32_g2250 [[Candida] boidinii]
MAKETRFYELLEISPDADSAQIKKAYRTKALIYHPDKINSSPNLTAEQKKNSTDYFQELSKAYEILIDSKKRGIYDMYGEEVLLSNINNNQDNQQQQQQQQHHHHQQQQRSAADQLAQAHQESRNYFNNVSNQFKNAENFFDQLFGQRSNSFQSSSFNSFSQQNQQQGQQQSHQNQQQQQQQQQHDSSYGYSENADNNNSNGSTSNNDAQRKHDMNQDIRRESSNNITSTDSQLRKGRDILHTVYCSLSDIYHGKKINLGMSKQVKCSDCQGRGGSRIVDCPVCHGAGFLINERNIGYNMLQRTKCSCQRCYGIGSFVPQEDICKTCKGQKYINSRVLLEADIPRGVKSGFKMVLTNEADEGPGIIPGDVIITVAENKSINESKFTRKGNNLFTEVSVNLGIAICGGKIKLKLFNGKYIKLYINRGDLQNPEALKKVKGYGMPIYNKHNISDDLIRFGDLIIKFNVRFPKADDITDRQYQLLNRALNSSRFSLKNNLSSSSEDNSMSGFSPARSSALAMNSGSTSATSIENSMAGNLSKGSKMSTGSSGNECNSSSSGKNNSRRMDSTSSGSDKSSKRQKMEKDGDVSMDDSKSAKSKSVKMKSDSSAMDGIKTASSGGSSFNGSNSGVSVNLDPSTVSTSVLASSENSTGSTGASSVADSSIDVNKIVDKEKRKAALEAADIEADRKEVELLDKVDKALADDEINEAGMTEFAENSDADDEQRESTSSVKENDPTDASSNDHQTQSLYVSDVNSNSRTYKENVSNTSPSSHTNSNDYSESDSDQKNTYASSDSGSDNEKIAYLSDYLEDDYNDDDDDDNGENEGDDPNGRSHGNSMFENFRYSKPASFYENKN